MSKVIICANQRIWSCFILTWCRLRRRRRLCGSIKGTGRDVIRIRCVDDFSTDVCGILLCGKGVEAFRVQFPWFHLRRYDKYSGVRYFNPCNKDRRRGSSLCGYLSVCIDFSSALLSVYRHSFLNLGGKTNA